MCNLSQHPCYFRALSARTAHCTASVHVIKSDWQHHRRFAGHRTKDRFQRFPAPCVFLPCQTSPPCHNTSIPRPPEMAPAFLGFPPEIRNLIYRYALGSSHLHIYGSRLRIRVCGNPGSYRCRTGRTERSSGSLLDVRLRDMRLRDMRSQPFRHYCWEKRVDRRRRCKLALGLLLACRQVYCEAALLPFGLNTFVFGTCTSLVNFLASLTLTQAAAVRKVIVESVTAGGLGSETSAYDTLDVQVLTLSSEL